MQSAIARVHKTLTSKPVGFAWFAYDVQVGCERGKGGGNTNSGGT